MRRRWRPCRITCSRDPVVATVTDYDGSSRQVRLWLHSYEGGRRNFTRPEPYFLTKGIERVGRIGNSTVKVLKAKPMVEYVLAAPRSRPEPTFSPRTLPVGPRKRLSLA